MKTYMKQYMTPEQNRIYWNGFLNGFLLALGFCFLLTIIFYRLALS